MKSPYFLPPSYHSTLVSTHRALASSCPSASYMACHLPPCWHSLVRVRRINVLHTPLAFSMVTVSGCASPYLHSEPFACDLLHLPCPRAPQSLLRESRQPLITYFPLLYSFLLPPTKKASTTGPLSRRPKGATTSTFATSSPRDGGPSPSQKD